MTHIKHHDFMTSSVWRHRNLWRNQSCDRGPYDVIL